MSEDALSIRLRQLERDVGVLSVRLDNVKDDMKEIRSEMRGVKRAMYALAFTIAAASITFAFSVLQFVH